MTSRPTSLPERNAYPRPSPATWTSTCGRRAERRPGIRNNNYLTAGGRVYQWCYTKVSTSLPVEPDALPKTSLRRHRHHRRPQDQRRACGRAENMMMSTSTTSPGTAPRGLQPPGGHHPVVRDVRPQALFGAISFGHAASPKRQHPPRRAYLRMGHPSARDERRPLAQGRALQGRVGPHTRRLLDHRHHRQAAHSAYMYADLQVEMPVGRYDKSHAVFTLSRTARWCTRPVSPWSITLCARSLP